MPAAVQSADRKLLIGVGVVLALTTLAGVFARPGKDNLPAFSSYSAEKQGTKAAFALLQETGYNIQRWEHPLSELPVGGAGVLLVMVEPSISRSRVVLDEEQEILREFVERGGHLLVTGMGGRLLPGFMITPEPEVPEALDLSQKFPAAAPSPLTIHAPSVQFRPNASLVALAPNQLREYGGDKGTVVLSYSVGKGKVVWVAGSNLLSNEEIGKASNLQFLMNCAREKPERILWDESLHGARQGLAVYFGRTPAAWFFVQFLIVFAAAVVTFSRRHGPLLTRPAEGTRLSPLEFVETVGDLYHRKHAAQESLDSVYQRFRFLLLRRLGLSPATATPALAAAVGERWSWRDPEFREMLEKCDRMVLAHEIAEKDALQLIREMHACVARWRLTGKGD